MAPPKSPTFEDALSLSALEKEVVTLKAALDLINDMVNHETMIFSFRDTESSIMFNTMTHKAYFNILLVDLLSVPSDFFNGGKNYIERLQHICENPLMGKLVVKRDIQFLKDAIHTFSTWLAENVIIEKRWFPSIDLEIDMRIKRQTFITMCGNISKHNFTQQTRQAKKLQKVLEENGQPFPLDKCLVALEDFQTQFYDDIFAAHAPAIAEFLNNIRWGIYLYAVAERSRCVENWYDEKMHMNKYKYRYPDEIVTDLGKTYYWNLMNDVMRPPYIQRFEVSKYFKQRY